MKALVINDTRSHYGFVIEVEQNRDGSYYDSVADLVYEARELQFQFEGKPIDWQAFRREATKDILAGMMAHQRITYGSNYEILAKYAILYADELIKQLKEQ